ncbi:MAG: penicillin-binding protein activator LpoB [Spirochaetaceae bacterium]|jgi:uncharacterized protein (TIGR02722 family)|nr:penicillin-binding protein activator LpoB [Spirochaetaceae bacterium]
MRKILILFMLLSLVIVGCSSGPEVSRLSSDTSMDLSGRWNDTDASMTAEFMIESMLSGGWLNRFVGDMGTDPVVIVGAIRNRSSEHIETATFVKDIERELVNSGRVIFVASSQEREELRDERVDQQGNATEDSMAALAAETGANFMLQGVITSQEDAVDGQKMVLYKVDMELINIENNQKVWIDGKEIKKFIERSRNSW